MRPNSAPEREVCFTAAGAYVDDNTTCIGEGVCYMPIACAEARHTCSEGSSAQHYVYLFRRNDGECDCCDGSDEPPGTCRDTCLTSAWGGTQGYVSEVKCSGWGPSLSEARWPGLSPPT